MDKEKETKGFTNEETDLLLESLRKNLEETRKQKMELLDKERKIIIQIKKIAPDEQV